MSLEDVCINVNVEQFFATPCTGSERVLDMATIALLESLFRGHESRTP